MKYRVGNQMSIDATFIPSINKFIDQNAMFEERVRLGLDLLAGIVAHIILGLAQKFSAGPWDRGQVGYKAQTIGRAGVGAHYGVGSGFLPRGGTLHHTRGGAGYRTQTLSTGAWKIPVRRITGAYWSGWYSERLGFGHWVVGNHSREAYFIEFGINPRSVRRVRRPILKMAVIAALEWIKTTNPDARMVQAAWSSVSTGSPELIGGTTYGRGSITFGGAIAEAAVPE